MTHTEHAAKQSLSTPCTAAHITFGGHCLNCGWRNEPPTTKKTLKLSGNMITIPLNAQGEAEGPPALNHDIDHPDCTCYGISIHDATCPAHPEQEKP